MITFEYLLYGSAVFAGSIAAYPAIATKNGWPRGDLYVNGISVAIYLVVMVLGIGLLVGQAYQEKTSWFAFVWFIGGSFIGGAFVDAIFGKITGAVSIIAAPALTIAALSMVVL